MSEYKLVPVVPTDEMIGAVGDVIGACETPDQIYRAMLAAAPTVSAEPVAYVNRDELDNMLDDRTATVAGVRCGWRRTPLYLHTPAPSVDEQDHGPDFGDGHDWEGFPGGCKRFGCPEGCSKPTAPAVAEWRPISTMPRSGEFLLGVWEGDWNTPRRHFRVYHAHGFSNGPIWAQRGNYRTEEGGAYELAGWMPLPTLPKGQNNG